MSFRNFLCPLQSSCLKCGKTLTKTKTKGTVVLCATMRGLETGTKYIYRCRPCSITYKYDGYVTNNNFCFYDKERPFVRASDSMYIERTKLDEYAQLLMHSQVSFESQAVTYNATFRNTIETVENFAKDNLIEIDEVGEDENESECEYNNEEYDLMEDGTDKENSCLFGKHDLSRKQISSATWNYLVEKEMRIRQEQWYFSKPLKKSFDEYMDHVDELRKDELLT